MDKIKKNILENEAGKIPVRKKLGWFRNAKIDGCANCGVNQRKWYYCNSDTLNGKEVALCFECSKKTVFIGK
jgi:hypothetical protein